MATMDMRAWRAKARKQADRIRRQHEHDHPENPVMTDGQGESRLLPWLEQNPEPRADPRKTAHEVWKSAKQSGAFHPTIEQGEAFRLDRLLHVAEDATVSTSLVEEHHVQAYSDLIDIGEAAEDAVRAERRKWTTGRLATFKANPDLKTLPQIERLFGYEGPLVAEPYKPMVEQELDLDDDPA
jgi:hypothetical protein